MVITTRVFGEIEIDETKIITFPDGIIGFPELKNFILVFDVEKSSKSAIKWLQSIEEPAFALPVMDPLAVCTIYNPLVESELLSKLGDVNDDNILVLVTVSIPPRDLKNMSINLQAPIVINSDNKKACQVIVDDSDGMYPVKYMIYDILKKNKEESEGK